MLGKTISHYEITDRLGEGAMGEVYAARDTLLGRRVAIKVMQTGDVATEESRLRFLQEARAASALNHPYIVTIHDVVRDGDADCIVMELVQGETLQERMSRGPLPLEQTLDIADRIADALSAAHARGIVHRDLKPGNVMITPTGIVKILDFGLAKLVSNEQLMSGNQSPRTQSGMIVGTPSYMSPEQVFGQPLDGRSDIFSLGTMAIEMLTGTNPFEAESVIATMHQIAYGEMPRGVMKSVPAPVAGLVERMLARKKEDRYQSADELRGAIAQVRSGGSIARSRTSLAYGAARRSRLYWSIGAAAVVLALALGAWQWSRSNGNSAAPAATAEKRIAPPKTAHEHVRRGNELLATFWREGYPEQAVGEFQRAIALEPRHAAAHAGLAMAYWRRYDKGKDKAWLALAQKNARHAVELEPQLASAHVALGIAELAGGNTDTPRKEFEQAAIIDPSSAAAHRWLSDVASRGKDDKTAEAELKKAIALSPRDPELHNVMGWFLYKAARYEEAAASFRRTVTLAPDFASAYRNLSGALHMRGDYAGAARALQQSLEIEPNAIAYSNLGTLYFFQGLYPQSVTAYEKAVQLGANNHVMWGNLGDAYRWTPGNEEKARDAFRTALALLEDEIRRTPDDAALQSRKALYLAKQGDRAGALAAADALMARKETNAQTLYRLALAYELSGARDRSLAALEKALRNGYSISEVETDPELAALRRDVQYQRMRVAVR